MRESKKLYFFSSFHCASDNHQELVVVKNVSFFREITSYSVVLVFMA